ncbi:WD40 repeat domain-containing protein [Singulisphaera sp. GP187]|uniref:WD40 repeat domain-containing protein n=1 Tax=Singulisphaera sp. GP187 TaxID=1882752 RepID=UPI0013563141
MTRPRWALVAVVREDGRAELLDAKSGRRPLGSVPLGRCLTAVTFSPDGNWLVTSGTDGRTRLWDSNRWVGAKLETGSQP